MEFETQFFEHCGAILEIVESSGAFFEGNCVYLNGTFQQHPGLTSKRINLQTLSKGCGHICEIGFNAGHSLLSMLLSNPSASYTVFDLGVHPYAEPCYSYIKSQFPATQIQMIWGDSKSTLPAFIDGTYQPFDLVHIDGGHSPNDLGSDWTNSICSVRTNGNIIVDDTNIPHVNRFVDRQIAEGRVVEVSYLLETSVYTHRVLKVV